MSWKILVDPRARKALENIPKRDSLRIKIAIDRMGIDLFEGDIEKLGGQENAWRKRVGSYRIFFEIYKAENMVYIFKIERRTSSIY